MPHLKSIAPWRTAGTIAGIYLVFSLLWILVSDRLLAALVSDSGQLTLYQTYKGLGFVIGSALLLLVLIQRELRRVQKLQATLQESEARYRHLFEANPHPMWIYDLETLAFLAINDAAVAHYGYSRDQFLAMTIKDIRPSADVQRLLENVAQVSQGLDEAGVWRHRRRDGSIIEVEITSHTLEQGGHPAELVLAHDITARRQAEAAMRQLNATLEQRVEQRTAQLEAVNRELEAFCYSVSHDLRAPLRAIDGFSGILLESYSPQFDAEGQRICRIIVENSRKMAQLIDHLLALSRFGRVSLEPTSVDMRTLAQEVFTDLTAAQDASAIQFRLGELPPAQGDPTLLRQVWSNLLGNALKFSAIREHPCIEVEGRQEQGEVRYTVRDNGAGFDMRYINKLFGVFQRLHSVREFPGSGVGLAIVERIVQRHGGKVWAEGTPGVGAVFYFTLKQSEE
ncbi:MAG: sensor histidine kinase [Trichloromonadaceae bacterium]